MIIVSEKKCELSRRKVHNFVLHLSFLRREIASKCIEQERRSVVNEIKITFISLTNVKCNQKVHLTP